MRLLRAARRRVSVSVRAQPLQTVSYGQHGRIAGVHGGVQAAELPSLACCRRSDNHSLRLLVA
jgi:hypothetical protein